MQNFFVNYKIKDMCKQRGLTIRDLAKEMGILESNFYRANNFRLENVCKMMIVLDCSFDDLFQIVKVENE